MCAEIGYKIVSASENSTIPIDITRYYNHGIKVMQDIRVIHVIVNFRSYLAFDVNTTS